ncbi:MAG: hypothetical protein ACREFY_10715 [Acetobacteraceae bacterium]
MSDLEIGVPHTKPAASVLGVGRRRRAVHRIAPVRAPGADVTARPIGGDAISGLASCRQPLATPGRVAGRLVFFAGRAALHGVSAGART